ncbi:related to SNU71 - component of U1 snRNP required for mRNA splicing via spliceosome [Ustilago trichophora]|uniref:Related to SNU71 - component of U1 snRNP required for mRNA splicing via spliceosome n=1 Tax=Ustilago trichophora TaxID=86804 RepID=A0A5C3E7H2_9BASI|nr:related to SNU71 - component of U1 snRNP required for mRNA splicing via spliceosome [Ustilago trichophora]
MSRRGHGSNWQGSHNPNMAPLPPRPRGGIGIGSSNNTPAGYGHSASPHSGYGSPHMRTSSYNNDTRTPAPEHASSSSSQSSNTPEVATTLFVGSISPGISDSWLTKILEACGNLRTLKRASKAFGFAEYADPDSVLRAIQVLHGRELPSMGAEASAPPKKLLVKADERTKKFLEKYQQTRVASSDDKGRENRALSAVKDIVRQMSDPNAEVETDPSKPGYVVPDHLKDLPPEELPEDQRATVLSEIEQFRQAAAARDAETRRREAEFERQRAVERARRENLQAAAAAAAASSSRNGRSADDPQGYRRPIDFHSASSYDAKADAAREPEEADEIEETQRQERKKAAARAAAADSERAYLVRERQRLAHWEKLQDRDSAESEKWQREGVALLRKWQDWRDDSATRKELFYTDRQRWRQFRASARRREEEADDRDRALEAEEKARAQEETDNFLAQQAAEMAKLTQQQRAAGVLVQEGGSLAPIKLNFASGTSKLDLTDASTTTSAVAGGGANGAASHTTTASKPAVLGDADEEDHTKRTGRLKHIQLGTTLSEEEKSAKLAQLTATLPGDTTSLFALSPKWEWVDEQLIQTKYRRWADAEIEESLGEKVEELVTVVIESLQSRAGAKMLVESVEPVLAEEAEAFVAKLWRLVIVDSLAAAEGIRV